MDEFTVIGVVSEMLKELLRQNLNNSFSGEFPKGEAVTLKSPNDLVTKNLLSLFLYHIVENPYMKNKPMERSGPDELEYTPLSINCYYLLTPHKAEGDSIESRDIHTILGRAMQVFYDNSILEGAALRDLLLDTHMDYEEYYDTIGQVRIILNNLSLDDLTKIWNSLETSLMLSVSYEVRVILIKSTRTKKTKRILEKNADYYQVKGKEGAEGS